MNFVIITHVPHIVEQNLYFAYAPYVREMNIWTKNFSKVTLIAPESKSQKTAIDIAYNHNNIEFVSLKSFDVLNLKAVMRTFFIIPKMYWQMYWVMKKADHIHLRCPGNIGLLGCLLQILFPKKKKTAKYAGNWDPKSKQPFSYKIQKWILENSFLTRNIQVLVYGQWDGSSKNIKPFFTATYQESDIKSIVTKELQQQIKLVYVGTLVATKNPLYAIRLVTFLYKIGWDVALDLYGEGMDRNRLEDYICKNNLQNRISLKGNQTKEIIQNAYKKSHFVVLPSESEGWPKAIAEGMFWGCVPVATSVSCVPFMLDYGNRGILLEMNLEKDAQQLELLLQNEMDYKLKSQKASDWSKQYTLNVFEKEIKIILNQ